jgi:energy-coupling factor transporter ATP-binding protein EcfA2
MSQHSLQVEDLTVSYRRIPALHHVGFSVPCGSCVAVLGPNGAGKSTLLKALAGLLEIETGEACMLRKGVSPRTTATLPDTPCKPEATSACATPSSANELWLLVPIPAANNRITYAPIRYYRSGTLLLRDGPQVDPNGLLTTTTATGSRVLTNISRFVPTVSTDCTWVSLDVGVTYPGRAEVRRSLSLYSGGSEMIN